MVFGVLFAHKRYPLAKYLFVLLIVLGCSLFLYKESKATASGSPFQFGYGEALLVTISCMLRFNFTGLLYIVDYSSSVSVLILQLFSLAMDGTTGAIQDRIRASYTAKSDHMMLNMNLWSCFYVLIGKLAVVIHIL